MFDGKKKKKEKTFTQPDSFQQFILKNQAASREGPQ